MVSSILLSILFVMLLICLSFCIVSCLYFYFTGRGKDYYVFFEKFFRIIVFFAFATIISSTIIGTGWVGYFDETNRNLVSLVFANLFFATFILIFVIFIDELKKTIEIPIYDYIEINKEEKGNPVIKEEKEIVLPLSFERKILLKSKAIVDIKFYSHNKKLNTILNDGLKNGRIAVDVEPLFKETQVINVKIIFKPDILQEILENKLMNVTCNSKARILNKVAEGIFVFV